MELHLVKPNDAPLLGLRIMESHHSTSSLLALPTALTVGRYCGRACEMLLKKLALRARAQHCEGVQANRRRIKAVTAGLDIHPELQ